MICPNCQTRNRSGANFCKNCGVLLAANCPRCRAVVQEEANFCDHCGLAFRQPGGLETWPPPAAVAAGQQPLPAPRAAGTGPAGGALIQTLLPAGLAAKLNAARADRTMVGERRVVTMLFCDLQGSTAAAEKLDPEEWGGIMNQAFEHMIRPIYKYEGTVARLMGDAILAFFGAPIAHEDDPQRAVLAALEIVEGIGSYARQIEAERGLALDARVGINTGLVVVGAVGSDLRMEYTALGDAINLAARMEQTAAPGTVQVAEDTYRRVAPLFEFEDLGGMEVKGKETPVRTYRPLRARTRPGQLRGIQGLAAPLIGRGPEMGLVQRVFSELQNGRGQILSIIGEAGLGKSRLIAEIQHSWAEMLGLPGQDGVPPRWTQSQGVSYDTGAPYRQWQQHMRQVCGITEADDGDTARQKLEAQLLSWPESERSRARRVFREILGLREQQEQDSIEGEALKRELFATMLDGFRATAGQVVPVVVFDDLHWADPISAELLVHIFQLTNEIPILFLCSFRPERDTPAWQVKQAAEQDFAHRYTEIMLRPLTASESEELVDSLLSVSRLPSQLREMIQQKSDGNPFFVEEVIRTLIESAAIVQDQDGWIAPGKIEEIEIPDNLQTLLMARIDRLAEEARRLLQLAAVIGRNFYYRVLQILSDTSESLDQLLGELQRVELIQEARRVPELEYMFRHALTQETAYKSILRQRRREFHLLVGETLAELFPDRDEEMAPVLAHHFDQGGAADKALQYYTRAGDAAFRLYANAEAANLYRRAIQIARQEGENQANLIHLYDRLGRSLELSARFEEALATYREMEALGEERGADAITLAGLLAQGTIYSTATDYFDPPTAEEIARRSLELAARLGDGRSQAKAHWNQLNSFRLSGEVDRAIQAGEQAIALAKKHGLDELLAYAINDVAHAQSTYGLGKAQAMFQDAAALWQRLDNQPMLSDSLSSASLYGSLSGDFEAAISAGQRAYQISLDIENIWGQSFSLGALGLNYTYLGEWDRAIEALEQSKELAWQAGYFVGRGFASAYQARCYVELGAYEKAIASGEEAVEQIPSAFSRFVGAAQGIIALAQIRQGELDAAQSVIEDLRPDDFDVFTFCMAASVRAQLQLARGDFEQAVTVCQQSRPRIEAFGARPDLAENLYLEGLAHLALKKFAAARDQFQRSADLAAEVRVAPVQWQVLSGLAALEQAQDNRKQARTYHQQAVQIIEGLLEKISDPGLRRTFLGRPDVSELLAA